jgi:dienelactone hydrolase
MPIQAPKGLPHSFQLMGKDQSLIKRKGEKMKNRFLLGLGLSVLGMVLMVPPGLLWAQAQRVVDIPTRPGVTQRFVYLAPESPKAAVILFAAGHGGLQIFPNGSFKWGEKNFLVRSRQLFAQNGLSVAVVDAPSDRQAEPFLVGFRQNPEHVADIKAVIAWLKQQANFPVWLVGTCTGTLSAAFIATQVGPSDGGPNGVVLTSSILSLKVGRPLPAMPLQNIAIPVLVVHHEKDGCNLSAYSQIPRLMEKLSPTPKKELKTFEGGEDRDDPCDALAYHGFNGLEKEVVGKISEWITQTK